MNEVEDGTGEVAMTSPWRSLRWVTALALVGGFLSGLLLWQLTAIVAQSNIRGDGWSLRGNGALIVPFLGVPAIVVAGTIALGRWLGRTGRWWPIAVAGVVLFLSQIAHSNRWAAALRIAPDSWSPTAW